MYVVMIKNTKSPEYPIMTTHIMFYKMYADMKINIIYRMRQFMTTYISHTQMYIDMIKNTNSPEQPIMTTYIMFYKIYADMMINIIYQMRQFMTT